MPWDHADKPLSAWATQLLGHQCYVVKGYYPPPLMKGDWPPAIAQLMTLQIPDEPALMIADGIHQFVTVSTEDEIPAGVAELKAGINDGNEC